MPIDLNSLGIAIKDEMDSGSGLDFQIVYFDSQNKYKEVEADTRLLTSLPKRKVVHSKMGQGETYASTSAKICREQFENESGAQDAVLWSYDQWIEFLLVRNGINELTLSLFFGDHTKAAHSWAEANKTKPTYVRDIIAMRTGIDIEVPPCSESRKNDVNGNTICFWRHAGYDDLARLDPKPRYFQQCTYGDAFFSYLCSICPSQPDQSFLSRYFLRQLIESTLVRVLVIDERVSQYVASRSTADLGRELAWQGIWIVGSIKLTDNNGALEFDENGEKKAELIVGASPNQENGLCSIVIDLSNCDERSCLSIIPASAKGFPDPPERVEILTIHQTILEKKLEYPLSQVFTEKPLSATATQSGLPASWKDEWIKAMSPWVLYTYVHSGRGLQSALLPERAGFLEFSIIQSHIMNRPSKFFLTMIALSNKRGIQYV